MTQNELIRYIRQSPLFSDVKLPPHSNRGVIDQNSALVWSHLDYLSASYEGAPYNSDTGHVRLPVPNDWFREDFRVQPIAGYSRGMQLRPYGSIYWSEGQENRGSLLVLGGVDLNGIRREFAVSDEEILARINAPARNITRLDFCANIDRGSPTDLIKHWKKGKVKARGKKPWERRNYDDWGGRTIYFGSEKSDKLLRCYNKAAQLHLEGGTWTRIELQLRGSPAGRIQKDMSQEGVKRVGKQAIRDFVNAPDLEWYQQALEDAETELTLTPAKNSSFIRWLNEQVGPAIAKRIEAKSELGAIGAWLSDMVALMPSLDGVIDDSRDDH